MNESKRTYDLSLVGANEPLSAHVVVTVRDWTVQGRRNRTCSVLISWSDQSIEASSWSVYHAFQDARAALEKHGLTPDCYGSCADVQTSGMLCDMGDGTIAVRISGVVGDEIPPMVSIFDRAADLQLGTVAEQKAYRDRARK